MVSLKEIILAMTCAVLAFHYLPSDLLGKDVIAGHARAIDGDTIQLSPARRIRLASIDSCELKQIGLDESGRQVACGEIAKAWLTNELTKGNVTCDVYSTDIYGRDIARCFVNGNDLGEASLRSGMSVADLRLAHGMILIIKYMKGQALAVWDRNGMWNYRVMSPKNFRDFQRSDR